jgi:hypothetical protein
MNLLTGMTLYLVAAISLAGAWVHWPQLVGLLLAWAGLSLMTPDNSFKWQRWLCNAFFIAIPWLAGVVA